MPLSTRRVQLCDPSDLALNPSEKGGARLALFDEPGDTKPFVLGKREVGDQSSLLSPPRIVKRQLVGVGTASAPGAPKKAAAAQAQPPRPMTTVNICHPACLRGVVPHVGLCLTAEGPMPPSIKRVHRYAKDRCGGWMMGRDLEEEYDEADEDGA